MKTTLSPFKGPSGPGEGKKKKMRRKRKKRRKGGGKDSKDKRSLWQERNT